MRIFTYGAYVSISIKRQSSDANTGRLSITRGREADRCTRTISIHLSVSDDGWIESMSSIFENWCVRCSEVELWKLIYTYRWNAEAILVAGVVEQTWNKTRSPVLKFGFLYLFHKGSLEEKKFFYISVSLTHLPALSLPFLSSSTLPFFFFLLLFLSFFCPFSLSYCREISYLVSFLIFCFDPYACLLWKIKHNGS